MVESVKRYYNNSFLDKQRQEAYNLFLGNYIFAQGQPMLWDLSTDYYLHHADPRAWFTRTRRSYKDWFTLENLEYYRPPSTIQSQDFLASRSLEFFDEWWTEYYRPHQLSILEKMLPYRLKSTYNRVAHKEGTEDKSPFKVRDRHDFLSPEKSSLKKTVNAADNSPPQKNLSHAGLSARQGNGPHFRLEDRVLMQRDALRPAQKEDLDQGPEEVEKLSKDKSGVTQWTLDQFVTNSLNPSVTRSEAHEYQRYVNHPLNLPLVVSTEIPPNASMELLNYINSISVDATTTMHTTADDLADYSEFLEVGEEPLTVTEADTAKKRYKAYRQWMKGKSLFKQRVDP